MHLLVKVTTLLDQQFMLEILQNTICTTATLHHIHTAGHNVWCTMSDDAMIVCCKTLPHVHYMHYVCEGYWFFHFVCVSDKKNNAIITYLLIAVCTVLID